MLVSSWLNSMESGSSRVPRSRFLELIGDDDGGRLLPLGSPVRTDFSDTLAFASVLLDLPELAPGGHTPAGMAWLLGADRVRSAVTGVTAHDGRRTTSWSGASASNVCSSVEYWPVLVFFGASPVAMP